VRILCSEMDRRSADFDQRAKKIEFYKSDLVREVGKQKLFH